jgi:outer membrane biosynthesis protein TonB
MIRGFAVSTLVHASVLALAVMSWPQPRSECDRAIEKLRRDNPGIRSIEIIMALPQCATSTELPIDFEDVGLVSNVSAMSKAPEPKPQEPEVQPEPEPQQAPPPEEAQPEEPEEVPLPVPEPKKEEPKKPEPKKEPPPKKEEPLIKKEPPKQEKKKDDLDFLNDIDKVLKDRRQTDTRQASSQEADRPVLNNADRDRQGAGDRSASTASLQAYVRREMRSFWTDVSDLPAEDQIEVTVRLTLNRDGSLSSDVELVNPSRRPVGRKGIAVDRALGAARKFFAERRLRLPEEQYEQWREIDVVFGKEMMNS